MRARALSLLRLIQTRIIPLYTHANQPEPLPRQDLSQSKPPADTIICKAKVKYRGLYSLPPGMLACDKDHAKCRRRFSRRIRQRPLRWDYLFCRRTDRGPLQLCRSEALVRELVSWGWPIRLYFLLLSTAPSISRRYIGAMEKDAGNRARSR